MNRIFIALLFLAAPAFAVTYSPADASKHIGELATVEGVASVYISRGGTAFIDLGGRGRSATFSGVIFKGNVPSDLMQYDGKTVDLIGTIKEYKGRPEIIIDDPKAQIRSK